MDERSYTRSVPSVLESGKLQLSPAEVVSHRAAAKRLREACEIGLDLTQPLNVDDWILLELAYAAQDGHPEFLESVIATVQAEIDLRRQSS